MKLLFLTILIVIASFANAEKLVVCYLGTWSVYRHSNGKFDVTDIDPKLCTHLVYAFFGIEETGNIRIIDPYLDLEENWGRGNIKKFNELKNINKNLKTLAAVGGWNEGSKKFSDVAKSPEKRQRFITSSVNFILQHGFDGLDLDWEYPAQRDGDPQVDKDNYSIFVRELKQELQKHNLLLSAAVASAEFSSMLSYDISEISKHLDFINVMAYDLHGKWDDAIGINAPLFAGPADKTEKEKQLNVNSAIEYWLSQGAPAEKIILGVPFYGRTFTLQNSQQTVPGSPHTGAGNPGKYTNEPGMIGYNEVCEQLNNNDWTVKWEETQKVPYTFKGNQWIGYENLQSIEHKTNYANEHKLGGIMVWSVETDDFRGLCGDGKYPLLQKINEILGTGETLPTPSTPSTPESSTQTTTSTTSTSNPTSSNPNPSEFECEGPTLDGTFRDPKECNVFYVCINGIKHDFKCPDPLVFDLTILSCNYRELVDCSIY